MKRRQVLAVLLMGMMIFHMAGCKGKSMAAQAGDEAAAQAEVEKFPLPEIRKQAQALDVNFKNLDLSEAVITVPETDAVYDMTFPVSTDTFERQVEKFEENIRKYEGMEEDADLTQYMTVMYWDKGKNDRLTVPLNEATSQQKKEVQYLGYNDGKCSQLIVFSNFMLEMGDYSVPTKLTGDDTDYSKKEYGYRGCDLGTLAERYDVSKDDISGISYRLSDGEAALSDAISYVEKHMKEDYYFAGSKLLDYHVYRVAVRELPNQIYYYEFDVGTSYQGLMLNKDDSMEVIPEAELEDRDPLAPQPFATNHLVTMFQKDRLGFIWGCCQNFESVSIHDTYEELLPLDEACRCLSNYISKGKKYKIASIELIYQTEFEYENEEKKYWGYIQSVHANPAYHFTLSGTGFSEFGNLYFDVNAVSGEVTAMSN